MTPWTKLEAVRRQIERLQDLQKRLMEHGIPRAAVKVQKVAESLERQIKRQP